MTTVFIADDHALIRHGIAQFVASEPDITVAGEAASGEEMLSHPALATCDVVLLDISLGTDNGVVLISAIRARNPRAAILMVSMHAEEHFAVRLLRMGANGYVQKNSAPSELVGAIRTVAAGRRYVSRSLAESLALNVSGIEPEHPHERLSPREFEVFLLIAEGRAVSEIAEKLVVSVNTVSTHRQRILQKLEMTSNASIIHYAVQRGLVG